MLIDSHRLTAEDRREWAALEQADLLHYALRPPRVGKAKDEIASFAAAHPDVFISTSWGKDSVVVCHIAADLNLPVVRMRVRDWDPPETDWVRDAFLADYPETRYTEMEVVMRTPMRGEPGEPFHQDALRECMPAAPRVTGVRAAESTVRALSAAVHGASTSQSCRPILRWTDQDVFGYLAHHKLPVHPAYAMLSCWRDRRKIRVHMLGTTVAGQPPWWHEWEDRYYGDVIQAAHQARQHMWRGHSGYA